MLGALNSLRSCAGSMNQVCTPTKSYAQFDIDFHLDRNDRGSYLGHGKFGAVYLCEKLLDHTMHACKEQLVTEETMMEVETLNAVNHPNLLELEAVYSSQWRVMIVTPYLRGYQTIAEFMEYGGVFSEAMFKAVFRAIVSGVQSLHSAGYTHGDLTSSNIMIDSTLDVKLIDLGQSRKRTFAGVLIDLGFLRRIVLHDMYGFTQTARELDDPANANRLLETLMDRAGIPVSDKAKKFILFMHGLPTISQILANQFLTK